MKPDDTEVLIKKAEILSMVNDFENAYKCFDRAISIDKNNPTFLEKKSMTYFIQKDFKNGLETINEAIKLNPNVGRYWAFKAGFLTSIGGYKEIEIETCISKAFALSPHDPDVKFYIDNIQKFRNKRENESERCFIATAAYGSSLCYEIAILRRFRDEKMLNSIIGEYFVNTYYKISPAIAKLVAKSELLKSFVRVILKPLIYLLNRSFENK